MVCPNNRPFCQQIPWKWLINPLILMLAIIIIHHDDGEVGETAELCPVKQKREMIFLRARRRTRPRCGIQRGATPPPPRPHRPVGGAEACILVDSCEIREFKQLVVFLAIGERERERGERWKRVVWVWVKLLWWSRVRVRSECRGGVFISLGLDFGGTFRTVFSYFDMAMTFSNVCVKPTKPFAIRKPT